MPTDPPLPADLDGWLAGTQDGVAAAVERLGTATGAELAKAEPRLRTALLPTTDKAYDVRRAITSQVLTLMAMEGRLVRGRPLGSWLSRQHAWEPPTAWWPDGIEPVEPAQARVRLVEEYLRRFGPALETDVAWWTGWAKGATRRALAAVDTVDRAGGLVLADDDVPTDDVAPTAVLLPALDPTPMGWKQRDWLPARGLRRAVRRLRQRRPHRLVGRRRWWAAGRCDRTAPSRPSCWPTAAPTRVARWTRPRRS
jgi:hypothetical protein